jgi:hypothetical protein
MSDGIRRIVCSNQNGETDIFLQASIALTTRSICSHENNRAYLLLKKAIFYYSKKWLSQYF